MKNPKGFSKTLHAVKKGFVICVGENPLKNPYF
jgi:hypothetical protein